MILRLAYLMESLLQGCLPSALFRRGLSLDALGVTAIYTAGLASVTPGLDPVASDLVCR